MMNAPIENALERRLALVETDLQQVKLDINGDAFKDFLGLRQRLRNAEQELRTIKEIVDALKEDRGAERQDEKRWRRLVLVLIALIAALACATLVVQFFYLLALPR